MSELARLSLKGDLESQKACYGISKCFQTPKVICRHNIIYTGMEFQMSKYGTEQYFCEN